MPNEIDTHVASDKPKIHPRMRELAEPIAQIFGLDDPTELDAALYEIQVLLYRCGYHLKRERAVRSERRQQAVARRRVGVAGAPGRGSGRPPGSAKLAARQLGLGLAQIWFELTGQPPARRLDGMSGREYGPYREFAQAVATVIPRAFRVRRKGDVPSVDFLVRDSIAEFRAAQSDAEDYRHRGLIDEQRWLLADDERMDVNVPTANYSPCDSATSGHHNESRRDVTRPLVGTGDRREGRKRRCTAMGHAHSGGGHCACINAHHSARHCGRQVARESPWTPRSN